MQTQPQATETGKQYKGIAVVNLGHSDRLIIKDIDAANKIEATGALIMHCRSLHEYQRIGDITILEQYPNGTSPLDDLMRTYNAARKARQDIYLDVSHWETSINDTTTKPVWAILVNVIDDEGSAYTLFNIKHPDLDEACRLATLELLKLIGIEKDTQS